MRLRRILEYLNREDADRAVKELGGRDLRGQAVRVDLHDDVSAFSVYTAEVRITRWPAQP